MEKKGHYGVLVAGNLLMVNDLARRHDLPREMSAIPAYLMWPFNMNGLVWEPKSERVLILSGGSEAGSYFSSLRTAFIPLMLFLFHIGHSCLGRLPVGRRLQSSVNNSSRVTEQAGSMIVDCRLKNVIDFFYNPIRY